MRVVMIALVTAACFHPSPDPGQPCPDGWCPPGQRCADGTCRADGDTAPDATTNSAPPVVSASPGPPVVSYWENAYAIPLSLVLAADDPSTMIYYTTDGATPTQSSPHAQTPIPALAIDGTQTVSYFGINAGGESPIRTELYAINSANQARAAFVITNVRLDGKSPVVVAMPNQQLMATATAQVWVHTACPTCPAQLVYGIDATRQDCIYANVPGLYPGAVTNPMFTVTAPAATGTYEVTVRLALEGTCGAAVANPGWEFRRVRIGMIVVR